VEDQGQLSSREALHAVTMQTRIGSVLFAAIVCAVAMLMPAGARPAVAADGLEIPFSRLGLGDVVELSGITASRTVTILVPDGLAPTRITGLITWPLTAGVARLEVLSGGERLAVFSGDANTQGTPLDIPIGSVPVVDGRVSIEIRTHLPFTDEYCKGYLDAPVVSLSRLAVVYGGPPAAPKVLADFLPSLLDTLVVWLPSSPTSGQVQPALDLVTALARGRDLRVVVNTHQGGVPDPGPFRFDRRDIVIGLPGDAGAEVVASPGGAPLLLLRGNDTELVAQVALLTGAASGVAGVPRAAISGPAAQERIPGPEQTFGDIGVGNLRAKGEGRVRLEIPFSQAAFGGELGSVRLRLKGSHTPIPKTATGAWTLSLNQRTLFTRALDDTGEIDTDVELPREVLRAANTLVVEAFTAPPQGICTAASLPIELTLHDTSTLTATRGRGVTIGFGRLPQALAPSFDLAVEPLAVPRIAAALALVADVVQASPLRLAGHLTHLAEVVDGTRPLLAVGAPADVAFLDPPLDLTVDPDTIVVAASGTSIRTGTVRAAASVADASGRPVVVVAAVDDASLTALIADLTGRRAGAGAVDGDVVALGDDGVVRAIHVRTAPGQAPAARRGPLLVLALVAGAAVLSGVVVIGALWKRRRSA
jgi:hypothetical protein